MSRVALPALAIVVVLCTLVLIGDCAVSTLPGMLERWDWSDDWRFAVVAVAVVAAVAVQWLVGHGRRAAK